MLGEHIQSQHLVIRYPNCPKCGTKMYLARLQPGKSNHDRLTFECPQCACVKWKSRKSIRAFRLPPGGISLMVAITAAVMMYMR